MPLVSNNGYSIYYEVTCPSQGRTLILVAGLGEQVGSIEFPEEQCEIFASQGFQVIRIDNRGCGLSVPRGADTNKYTLHDLADDISAVADDIGVETIHLVGASLGGLVARWFAIRHASRLASLTIVMSGSGAGPEDAGPQLTKEAIDNLIGKAERKDRTDAIAKGVEYWRNLWGGTFAFDESWVRERVASSYDRAYRPDEILKQLAASGATKGLWEAQTTIDCPTLIMHGDEDPCFGPDHPKATASQIPNSELWLIPGMGHIMHKEHWAELASRINKLARL